MRYGGELVGVWRYSLCIDDMTEYLERLRGELAFLKIQLQGSIAETQENCAQSR